MIRACAFFVFAVFMGLGTVTIAADAILGSGGYGCMGPPSLLSMPPVAICGLACLLLAREGSQRITTVVVLAVAIGLSAVVLSRPSGYPARGGTKGIGDVRTGISTLAA